MTDTETTIEDCLTSFRLATFEWLPYLSDVVYALQPVERPGLGTMAVDKWCRLYYDPEFVGKLTKEQGAWVILHEVSHLTLRHHARSELIFGNKPTTSRSTEDFNIAADLVVYELLEQFNHNMPHQLGQLVTMQWAKTQWPDIEPNMTVEQVYGIIASSRQDEDGDGGEGDEEGEEQEQEQEQEGGGGGDDQESDAPKPWPGGSSADAVPRDYELEPDPNWEGYVEDELLRRVEEKLQNATPGTAAGTFADSIRQHLRPAPDPWKKLSCLVGMATANAAAAPQHTYSRRNRRQGCYPGMPLLKGKKYLAPKACCIIDTSGSMTTEALCKAVNAVNQGVKSLGGLRVIWGDVRVCGDVEVKSFTPTFTLTGRGGTDMIPLIEHAVETHDPDLICVVTDGWTPWPKDKLKKARMVVALTEESAVRSLPKWCAGHVIIPSLSK